MDVNTTKIIAGTEALNLHNEPVVINNLLKWDGSHVGSYIGAFTHQWSVEGIRYYGITLPQGWSEHNNLEEIAALDNKQATIVTESPIPGGTIYCTATCTKDVFPCIVEDIKSIFGLPRRGIHRITIDNRDYLIYYVPISIKGQVIWETPLNRLDSKHVLRQDPVFRKEVQKIIAFCDILALSSTGEPSIRIRPGSNGKFIPISVNESTTTITKGLAQAEYDYSILTKTLFSKWFGEEISISNIVKEMVNYKSLYGPIKIPIIKGTESNDLVIISSQMRSKVDEVIKKYDTNYIWYSYFIIDRMSRNILVDT